MSYQNFTLNVTIRHPVLDSEKIISEIELPVINAWSQGDLRVTPAGKLLGGTRAETMCSFVFALGDLDLNAAFKTLVNHLEKRKNYLELISKSGGDVNLNIRMFSNQNCFIEFDSRVLMTLAGLGVHMSIETISEERD